ncbi:MAG: N-6 DNA methylase [Clostridioides difficile]|nr:N-6 DNA methylase [Clostridioides difficile]
MKDTLCSYYTDSHEITTYMSRQLDLKTCDKILEPAAGEGAFIDALLRFDKSISIDALDIDDRAVGILKEKYQKYPNVYVKKTDTLLDDWLDLKGRCALQLKNTDTLLDNELDMISLTNGHYDKIIGNPPYGAWQDYSKRELLKRKYPGQYVKETYSLFLLRCISLLKIGGILSFIIPDTFLYLNLHSKLRKYLLENTEIKEIAIFPSKFFPGVSFGYSNLSIITLKRILPTKSSNNIICILRGFSRPSELLDSFNKVRQADSFEEIMVPQIEVIRNPQYQFLLGNVEITSLLKRNLSKLGDVAEIATGFYTGDNKKFIRVKNERVKGAKGYEVLDRNLVYSCTSLNGIDNVSEGYIPYVKGAPKGRYCKQEDDWYVRWDSETIKFYNHNKKSRFQNSQYYFRTGVGVPMVKSKVIKAFLMEQSVFDQSIVGIFPKDITKLYYVLALMNSDIINEIVHVINPTANNSSNYIKQIPYIEPSTQVLRKINNLVEEILKLESTTVEAKDLHAELNKIVADIYSY